MPKAHLTDISVRALKAPAQGQVTYWDRSMPRFGLRVSAGGAKTWTIMHGAARKRVSIGRYPILGLAKARERAKEMLAEITLGKTQPPTISFADLLTLFLTSSEGRNKPRTTKDYKRLLNRHFLPKFRLRQVHDIRAQDISAVVDKLAKTPSEQNHALTAAKAIFRFAVRRHYLTHSPCEGMPLPSRRTPRDRVLTDKELAAVYKAAGELGSPFGVICQLCILLGQRRGEIGLLRDEHLNREEKLIKLPPQIVKNNREHEFPYGDTAARILDAIPHKSGYLFPAGKPKREVFNGWAKQKRALDAKLAVAPWTLHDLRRTFSTNLARLGVYPHVIERILNHVTGTLSPIARVYNRATYLKEMRDAMTLWESHLRKIVEAG